MDTPLGLDVHHIQMSSAVHSARSVQAASSTSPYLAAWRPLGPANGPLFSAAFLSKVELEPVREMRALVDGFLLLAPCNSMGRLVYERLASVILGVLKDQQMGSISGWLPVYIYLSIYLSI